MFKSYLESPMLPCPAQYATEPCQYSPTQTRNSLEVDAESLHCTCDACRVASDDCACISSRTLVPTAFINCSNVIEATVLCWRKEVVRWKDSLCHRRRRCTCSARRSPGGRSGSGGSGTAAGALRPSCCPRTSALTLRHLEQQRSHSHRNYGKLKTFLFSSDCIC